MEMKSGAIPDGWKSAPLGQLCGRITTGKLDANAMVTDGDYPFFTCARESYRINKYAFDCEALLVSGNGANVGYVHYYKGKFNAYQRTYVMSDFSADVHFLKLFLDRNVQDRIRVEVNAGNTPYITMGTLTEMGVVLPDDAAEQGAIATALSDVDGLLDGLDRLIAKKRDLKQAAMQQLLTGQTRLPNFDGAWAVRQFGSLIEQVFPKSTLSSGDGLEHGTYPLIVSGGVPKRTEVAQFRDNIALVFSDGGIFAVRYAKGSFSVTDHCYALKLNPALADMRWVEAWFSLHEQQMDRLTFKGSGLRNLDKPSLRNIEIRCPEPVEQAAIADALNNMDAELEALEARRDKTNMLKQGMMQELLTGRIRLVEAEVLHA